MRAHIYVLVVALCAISARPSWAQTQSQQDNSASQTASAKQGSAASAAAQTPAVAGATKAAKPAVVFTNENLKDPAADQTVRSAGGWRIHLQSINIPLKWNAQADSTTLVFLQSHN